MVRVVAILVALSLGGCLNATFLSNRPPGDVVYHHHPFFLGGLIGEAVIDVGQLCPDGAHSVRSFWSGIDVVLTVVTVGIYSPRTTEVICAAPADGGTPSGYSVLRDAQGKIAEIRPLVRP